jgi:hypothetical protein
MTGRFDDQDRGGGDGKAESRAGSASALGALTECLFGERLQDLNRQPADL